MRPLGIAAGVAVLLATASANACPMIASCMPPQPTLVGQIVLASASELVDMANADTDEGEKCESWANVMSPSVWYGVGAFSWTSNGSFARRMSDALELRRSAVEMRAHAATYRARAIVLRERAMRMFDAGRVAFR